MTQLVILSGKGGTGKTTVADAFIRLSKAKAYADCDVDAPNLHLLLQHSAMPERTAYYGLGKATIRCDICTDCGRCAQHCRFGAITSDCGYHVNEYACEGCGVCEALCPVGAVEIVPAQDGELALYLGSDSAFSTAKLKTGAGASGKLVAEVKKRMKEAAPDAALSIVDGSPGIGCPVIATISGAELIVVVAEPSISGISDMERILGTADHFRAKAVVCINKYDTNRAISEKIEELCRAKQIPVVGKIPFDPNVVKALNAGLSIVEVDCAAGNAVRGVFEETMKLLQESRRCFL